MCVQCVDIPVGVVYLRREAAVCPGKRITNAVAAAALFQQQLQCCVTKQNVSKVMEVTPENQRLDYDERTMILRHDPHQITRK